MTREEERELVIAAQAGCRDSLAKILKHHERALWKIARETTARGETPEDLYQIACVHFLDCLRKFDPNYGVRLSTFTYRMVQTKTYNSAFCSGLVRLPSSANRSAPDKVAVVMRHIHQIEPDWEACAREEKNYKLIDDADEVRALELAIDRLPNRLHEYMRLRIGGLERIIIARLWGISRERARQLEEDAIKRLRWLLGVTPTVLRAVKRRGTMRSKHRKSA